DNSAAPPRLQVDVPLLLERFQYVADRIFIAVLQGVLNLGPRRRLTVFIDVLGDELQNRALPRGELTHPPAPARSPLRPAQGNACRRPAGCRAAGLPEKSAAAPAACPARRTCRRRCAAYCDGSRRALDIRAGSD